ncbi:mismatch repair endonuclease PMS2 isoform X2 [Parasteatoda tepidariorum]|nr:mismatch repair endonuclease PMS2 isoform X2 [Parasteatoda tepidariorum]XP_042906142.1 mismatch repair endonuclease PMS2 isoform X2 [Parasteatoda tepidariorum]XP_042906143.1 mismatch repair endonuclease PMS2 isoform X2 [Parasteatoda tepidariorum]XP_042906144.1 mismatch repair endonuclease PMS2 isoform X2 [Parasteatoda tepidariorum]
MEQGNIKPIDRTSVHKICSGQVVLTLATAVKELVENSIDAGATVIDVKLEDYGSKLIEVSDNGKGVKSQDFQSLTLKHHTSKIADFSDLPFVSTFGFRGEALSSLCALSDLEVTTRNAETEVGTNLKFDHNGKLVKASPAARQIGTTVILRKIFSTYPVRHKEFTKNVRREFTKMIQLLTAYCLISINKKITCTNCSEKGRKNVVLATHNSKSSKENIVSLFGDKQMKQIMEIKQRELSDEVLKEYFLPESSIEKSKIFKLEGFISNSTHGEGRSSSDRQFYFISGRPCDLPKVSKLINEVYHSFNKHQYPFVLMNVSLVEAFADVNVTPDKRQIFIPDEKVLLALVKSTLLGMYGSQPAQITMSPLTFIPVKKDSEDTSPESPVTTIKTPKASAIENSLKRKFHVPTIESDEDEDPLTPRVFKSQKLDVNHNNPESESTDAESTPSCSQSASHESLSSSQTSSSNNLSSQDSIQNSLENSARLNTIVNFTLTLPFNEDKVFKKLSPRKTGKDKLRAIFDKARKDSSLSSDFDSFRQRRNFKKSHVNEKIVNYLDKECTYIEVQAPELISSCSEETEQSSLKCDDTNSESKKEQRLESDLTFDEPSLRKKKYRTIFFHMNMLTQKNISTNNEESENSCAFRKFRSKIQPNDNQKAEEELKKEISKDSFSKMDIIGQFNLGFIITRLLDDLFIIDQHATDEKYNFEQLQKETILETQQLFQPQPLNLSAVSEAILLDNLNVFEKNGFKFEINEENPTGEKVQMVSVPVSQSWKFGKEDVDELIFMLTDNPIRMVRPSRVNQMFASRACRKSVMIGTALTSAMMKKLVTHMGEIEQPWNCPHGRPTMRHLFNLRLLNPL